jgi:DNA-binding beta-propeller fold protein YncE
MDQGLAADQKGSVYIAATGTGVVDTVSSSGFAVAAWGSPGVGPRHFAEPVALAVDDTGNLYVADRSNNCIQKLSPSGKPLALWGGPGPHDGSDDPGKFRHPSGIAVDRIGDVYVADTGNDRIEEFSPTGKLLAMQGSPGSGPGQFRHPMGIALDQYGNVYVADTGNNRVQKLIHRA